MSLDLADQFDPIHSQEADVLLAYHDLLFFDFDTDFDTDLDNSRASTFFLSVSKSVSVSKSDFIWNLDSVLYRPQFLSPLIGGLIIEFLVH